MKFFEHSLFYVCLQTAAIPSQVMPTGSGGICFDSCLPRQIASIFHRRHQFIAAPRFDQIFADHVVQPDCARLTVKIGQQRKLIKPLAAVIGIKIIQAN